MCKWLPWLLSFGLSLQVVAAEAEPANSLILLGVAEDHLLRSDAGFPGGGFNELSRYLYGGSGEFSERLAVLNPQWRSSARVPRGAVVMYPAPYYVARRGDTLQQIAARWAGGSAYSYVSLLPLNPQLSNPDRILPGQRIYLPRVPRPAEHERWVFHWVRNNRHWAAAAAPAAPLAVAPAPNSVPQPSPPAAAMGRGPFAPKNADEHLGLLEWYLDRLDSVRDRERIDPMIDAMLASGASGWRSRYVAGQHYLNSRRPERAAALFREALTDPEAPIQVGLFYLRGAKQAGRAIDGKETEKLYDRFPALKSLEADSP